MPASVVSRETHGFQLSLGGGLQGFVSCADKERFAVGEVTTVLVTASAAGSKFVTVELEGEAAFAKTAAFDQVLPFPITKATIF